MAFFFFSYTWFSQGWKKAQVSYSRQWKHFIIFFHEQISSIPNV